MASIRVLSCCGGIELIGFNNSTFSPKEIIKHYMREYEVHHGGSKGKAFITFAYAWDVGKEGSGLRTIKQGTARLKAFVKFVEDNELGDIHLMPRSSYNPNYGKRHRIRTGVYVPDNAALREFYLKDGSLTKPRQGWHY